MAHTDAKRLKFTQAIFVGRGRNWILGSLALFGSFFSMSLPPPPILARQRQEEIRAPDADKERWKKDGWQLSKCSPRLLGPFFKNGPPIS